MTPILLLRNDSLSSSTQPLAFLFIQALTLLDAAAPREGALVLSTLSSTLSVSYLTLSVSYLIAVTAAYLKGAAVRVTPTVLPSGLPDTCGRLLFVLLTPCESLEQSKRAAAQGRRGQRLDTQVMRVLTRSS